MQIDSRAGPHGHAVPAAQSRLEEIVMGLHWDPPQHGTRAEPQDLDAVCVLFDGQSCVLEVIHPGHPRNANGSVVHTGDSRTGASEWDDERIFVFPKALPDPVSALAFVVVSARGLGFGDVRGASCHISDHATEREHVRLDLTTLGACSACCIATLSRDPAGWSMVTDAHATTPGLLAEIQLLVASAKNVAP